MGDKSPISCFRLDLCQSRHLVVHTRHCSALDWRALAISGWLLLHRKCLVRQTKKNRRKNIKIRTVTNRTPQIPQKESSLLFLERINSEDNREIRKVLDRRVLLFHSCIGYRRLLRLFGDCVSSLPGQEWRYGPIFFRIPEQSWWIMIIVKITIAAFIAVPWLFGRLIEVLHIEIIVRKKRD